MTIPQIVIDKVAEFDSFFPDWQVAEMLNAPVPGNPKKIVSKLIGYNDILTQLGAIDGGNLLAALEAEASNYPFLKYAFKLLDRDALDIGSPATHEALSQLVVNGILPEAAVALVLQLASGDSLSWCELNGVIVDAQIVGLARGGSL